MPRIRYCVAASLDGYIADLNGGYDWIVQDATIDFAALFAQFDTFLVGRKTFELMTKPGSPPQPQGSRTFVVSRTLSSVPAGFTLLSGVTPEVIDQVKAQAKKDVWLFGGGVLFRSLLDQGLVDTVEVAIIPVLLGGGLQLLPQPARQSSLRLTGQRVYPSGIVLVEYAVDVVRPLQEP